MWNSKAMLTFLRKNRTATAERPARGASPETAAPPAPVMLAGVMRAIDTVHSLRTRMAKSTGAVPTILAYPGYGGTGWVRVLARVVLSVENGMDTTGTVRGWRAFASVPVRHSQLEVQIGDAVHTVHADTGGLVDVVLESTLTPGWHTVVLRSPSAATAETKIHVIDPEASFGIISDIDDTVMVTALPRPFLALWNTFVLSERARTPTPGMAVLLDRVVAQHPGAPTLYLSTGAWNVAPALTRFLARNLYPAGGLLLTDWGPTREHWFRSGREHKHRSLERLAREFPGIRWLLVGDDGQHDPEIYAEFARTHAAQTAAVAIRQLSPSEALLAGGRTLEDSLRSGHGPVTWVSAPDGAGLAKQLKARGIF